LGTSRAAGEADETGRAGPASRSAKGARPGSPAASGTREVYLYSASAWRHDLLHHRGRDDLSSPANVDRNASTRNQRIPVLRPFIKRPNTPLKPSVRHFHCGPCSRRLCYQQEPKCGT
jgi:hypothetical protein